MTTLGQVKTYVQNHLVAVVATSLLALVSVSTIATTIYQTRKNEHKDDLLSIFNLKSYEGIKKLFGNNSEEEKLGGDEGKGKPVEGEIKGNENQMQQLPVDEAEDQH